MARETIEAGAHEGFLTPSVLDARAALGSSRARGYRDGANSGSLARPFANAGASEAEKSWER
ncbi:MAG: hypothetical protein ABWX89_08060, partial [Paeniglutamicibacter terrestris]